MIHKAVIVLTLMSAAASGVLWRVSHTASYEPASRHCGQAPRTIPGWHKDFTLQSGNEVTLQGHTGSFSISYSRSRTFPPPAKLRLLPIEKDWRQMGLTIRTYELATVKNYYVRLPFSYLVAVLLAYPTVSLAWALHRRWRRRRNGLCINCGYDLTGNVTGVCSECGKPT